MASAYDWLLECRLPRDTQRGEVARIGGRNGLETGEGDQESVFLEKGNTNNVFFL